MSAQFLAFDLGAESGRAIVGRLRSGVLDIREVHRFPNEPVRQNGALHWDVLRLWFEMRRALERISGTRLESLGVDTWGCDYALLGEQGHLLQNPFHYRDRRTDGVMESVFQHVPADEIYAVTGIQFLPFNTLFQLYAACRATPQLIERASTLLDRPRSAELLADRPRRVRIHQRDDDAVRRRADPRSWATGLLEQLGIPTRLLPPLVEPGHVLGQLGADCCAALAGTPVVAPACHDTGSAVASIAAGGTAGVPQLRHLVAARHRGVARRSSRRDRAS